jgi:hypothetical protein
LFLLKKKMIKKLSAFVYQDFVRGAFVTVKAGFDHAGTVSKILSFCYEPPSQVMHAQLVPLISTADNLIEEWIVPLTALEHTVSTPELVREINNKTIMLDQYHVRVPPYSDQGNWDGVERRSVARN